MKKLKNILIIMVLAIITLIVMPNKVMAETQIEQIIYSGTQVYTGNKIPSVVNVETYPAGGIKEKTVPVIWYESDTADVDMPSLSLSDQLDLSENPTFKENKYYFVERNPLYVFDLNEGYEWTDHTLYVYNYRGMTDYDYGKKTTISFIRALTPITEVKMNVSNFTVGKTVGDITLNSITRNPEEAKMSDFYKVELNLYKKGTSTKLEDDYVLKENEEYEIAIINLYRAEAYVTTENTKYYINDKLGTTITMFEGTITGCFKAEKPVIKELKIDGVEEPAIGNKVTQTTIPTVTVEPNILSEPEGRWRKATSTFDKNHKLTRDYVMSNSESVSRSSNFEEGIYILMLAIGFEYDVTLDTNFKVMINGLTVDYEVKNDSSIYVYKISEVKSYSYKYLSGDNQEFTEGKLDSYTYKIDGDYDKFESLKIGDITLDKDTDYIVTKGSTIITLTDSGTAKLNKLAAGTYSVETKFTGNTVTGKLIIKEDKATNNIIEENNNNIENPNTGDEIITSVILGFISLIILVGSILFISKNKKYN